MSRNPIKLQIDVESANIQTRFMQSDKTMNILRAVDTALSNINMKEDYKIYYGEDGKWSLFADIQERR